MNELYHLWVENRDGVEYCDNLILDDSTLEEIRNRLDKDVRIADYVLERELSTRLLTVDEVINDLEPFLGGVLR
jgi:hypothetical protein